MKGQDTVYVVEGRAIRSLKTDPKELRDRSVLMFNPPEIDKAQITLDGKTWLAVQGQDKKWTLEKPEKADKVDTWAITGLLWSLKDLEWKSIASPLPIPHPCIWPITAHGGTLQEGRERPDSLESRLACRGTEKKEQAKRKPDNKKETAAPELPIEKKTPPTVNVSVQPSEEQNAVFVLDGNFVERLRGDLERLTEKKK